MENGIDGDLEIFDFFFVKIKCIDNRDFKDLGNI